MSMVLTMRYRVVLSQLSGGGRGDIGSYNAEHYAVLTALLDEMPMKDGDEWMSAMMKRNKMLGTHCWTSVPVLLDNCW